MYEHLRNDFLCALDTTALSEYKLTCILQALDLAASRYDVQLKELSLTVYNDDLPELAKMYIVGKKTAVAVANL